MASALQQQLAAASAVTDKYEVIRNIGRGSFGIISMVKRKSDNQVLCRKEIHYAKMQQKEREQLQQEVSILKSLRHPNIVSYFDTVHVASNSDLHLYMEYCGGGDLGKVIQDLAVQKSSAQESYVWMIVSQLLSALYRCHYGMDAPEAPKDIMEKPKAMGLRSKSSMTILHRDLKPENIFLSDEWSVKLGDFGLSKQIAGGSFATTYVGTPYYMSPEICNGERYTLKSDVWSMGCIIYELCTTRPPFDAKTHVELATRIRRGTYDPIGKEYSRPLHELIRSCLQVNPINRPSTADLLDEPMVRLMRREASVNEREKRLAAREETVEQTRIEAEKLLVRLSEDRQKLEADRREMEHGLNERLRREWEVRANLKIKEMVDQQVAAERQRLHQQWEEEFPRRVVIEVERRMQEQAQQQEEQLLQQQRRRRQREQQSGQQEHQQHHNDNAARLAPRVERSTSPETAPGIPSSSPPISSQSMATDEVTTDLSSFSMVDSPFKAVEPVKVTRKSRTPFTRAKAQTAIESPIDVQMMTMSPSPINSLSLSPRRNKQQPGALASGNLFVAADRAQRWQAMNLSDVADGDSESELDIDDGDRFSGSEDEDVTMPLPSPTLARKTGALASAAAISSDPFKAPSSRTNKKRPSLGRQQTMPVNRMMMMNDADGRDQLGAHHHLQQQHSQIHQVPVLFNKNVTQLGQQNGKGSREESSASSNTARATTSSSSSTSPTRERRAGGGLKTARTDGDMFRDMIVQRNAHRRQQQQQQQNGAAGPFGGRTLGELAEDQVSGRGGHTIVPQAPLVLSPKDRNLPFGGAANGTAAAAGKENLHLGPSEPVGKRATSTLSAVSTQHHDFASIMVMGDDGYDSSSGHNDDVAVWNPEEVDEMPSPFLCKTRGRGILPVR